MQTIPLARGNKRGFLRSSFVQLFSVQEFNSLGVYAQGNRAA
jgi:hypothetical protein